MKKIAQAVFCLHESGVRNIILLHCVSDYSSRLSNKNLRVIETVNNVLQVRVGYSDHTVGLTAHITAVSLGAAVDDENFTLRSELNRPYRITSIERYELVEPVNKIRECERVLGHSTMSVSQAECNNAAKMCANLHAATDLEASDRLTVDKISIVRTVDGLEPRHFESIVGSQVSREITGGEPLLSGDFA